MPLHQLNNLAAIRAVAAEHRDLPQVACFDTGFDRGRSRVTELFGLPRALLDRGVRRYGFHGLSYKYIVERLRQTAPEVADGRLVVAHLGSGCSMTAIRGGRSVDTTMGFSALDGVPMGTRCGALDPGVLLFLLREDGLGVADLERILYKESGLLGLSGVSDDLRDLHAIDDPRAAEAIDYFIYRIGQAPGALAAGIGGLDALIVTAGIGENDAALRALAATLARRAQFEPGLTIHRLALIYPRWDYSLSQPSVYENGEGYLLEIDRILWMSAPTCSTPRTAARSRRCS